nr:hypothetical protein [Tanacetum cinerariifolium]
KHEEAAATYVDLKHNIEGLHDATYKAYEDTETSLNNYEKLLTQFKTHTVLVVAEAYTKNLAGFTELLSLVKTVDLVGLKSIVESLLAAVIAQNDYLAK